MLNQEDQKSFLRNVYTKKITTTSSHKNLSSSKSLCTDTNEIPSVHRYDYIENVQIGLFLVT